MRQKAEGVEEQVEMREQGEKKYCLLSPDSRLSTG
jgi:hypothetical protein